MGGIESRIRRIEEKLQSKDPDEAREVIEVLLKHFNDSGEKIEQALERVRNGESIQDAIVAAVFGRRLKDLSDEELSTVQDTEFKTKLMGEIVKKARILPSSTYSQKK